MNNSSNGTSNNLTLKKTIIIARWIIGGFFTLFALINGFHYSSLFLLCAAFLMFPLPFMTSFLQKKNIKSALVIILSVMLFFLGAATAPSPDEPSSNLDNTTQSSVETPKNDDSNSSRLDSSSSAKKPDSYSSYIDKDSYSITLDNSSSDDEKVEMVWISSSGNKYHSKSTCSGMKSPRQISLDEAIERGFTACKKCH